MKKIAVLVHSLGVEYTATVVKGIYDYFKDKDDVVLFISQTRQPHYQAGISEYQYWRSAQYLTADSIDAVIILTNSYVYSMDKEKVKEIFSIYKNKPVISVGMDIGLENSCYTVSRPYDVYDEIVGHLKNEQGCKKIAFFSANQTGSPEAFERFNAYKKAIEKHGFEFDEKLILEGKFTMSSSKDYLKSHYPTKESINFDSIICANDLMGVATMEYLETLGLEIPEDVKVFGFDNTSHAMLFDPPLATVDQQSYEQGVLTAKLAERILNNEKVDKVTETPLKTIYRYSCGYNKNHDKFGFSNIISQNDYFADITRIDVLIDMLRSNVTLQSFVQKYEALAEITGFDVLYCCIMDEPVEISREDDFVIPEKARMLLSINADKKTYECFDDGVVVYPHKQLFPDGITPGSYMFQPLYLGKMQYGYYLCRTKIHNFAANHVNLKMLSSAIVQNYEYTKAMKAKRYLEEENQDLNIKSKTDELTKILNRRGFMTDAQKVIDFSVEMGTGGIVFFADLDGLKTINDTYGHEIGDKAIQTQAQVLQKVFRQSDIIGRLSGDEFAVVAPGMPLNAIPKLKGIIESFNREFSGINELPFIISLSFGAVEFDGNNKNLSELLKQSDSELYVEKHQKHGKK